MGAEPCIHWPKSLNNGCPQCREYITAFDALTPLLGDRANELEAAFYDRAADYLDSGITAVERFGETSNDQSRVEGYTTAIRSLRLMAERLRSLKGDGS